MLERLGPLPARPVLADLGCSTGYLLEDLDAAHPDALLIGVDLVASGLRKAHRALVPRARLLQADVCALPLEDASVDAALSANLLEHVPDDQRALGELRRVLRPGRARCWSCPPGPAPTTTTIAFSDTSGATHGASWRRKARGAGLEVIEDVHLGSLLYPPFWLVKQRNRRRYGRLPGAALERRAARDIARTRARASGALACRLEREMLRAGRAPAVRDPRA